MLIVCSAILKRLKGRKTLEEIYQRESGNLLTYAEIKLGDRMLAEDMVADTFEKLMRSFHRYDHLEDLEMHRLLLTILQNRIIDWQRKAGREKNGQKLLPLWQNDKAKGTEETIENSVLTTKAWELYQKQGGIEEYGLRREMLEQLLKYIRELPEQSRKIFMLCHYEGWKPQRIAKELGLPIRTVNQQLYRTKLKLKEKMKNDGYEEGDCRF